ncbi:MAG: SpoIIE family protein phosphatase [Bacteroidia bacterium]|nr:SpoIIE family protein phosphatase [Bacteroidia bacterium]
MYTESNYPKLEEKTVKELYDMQEALLYILKDMEHSNKELLDFREAMLYMLKDIDRMNKQLVIQNEEIKAQNEEIKAQNEEIKAQRDEIEAQRDEISKQNHLLLEQKKELTDSINYAKRIQTAVLPTGEYANSILGKHFILFKPKDIVSGDFYWGTRINEWLIFTVADCTGHGVPGAFMSMLGVSFLNEIVRRKKITKASQVLDHLRDSIIEALQQKGQSCEQKDGMDIVLCALNTTNNLLQYAGANNSLFIVTAQKEIKEISPDKQPVAIYENMKPFTNHIINLQKGDTIYLTSDGYEDQFGGPNNKKFKIKQLKELFIYITDKTMDEQKNILVTTFENWKGEHEQIDDVTILGLKI